jgi:phosphohistidine phosphatase
MIVYFLRHGTAERRSDWSGDDDDRPLTDAGRSALRRAGATLAALDFSADAVLTSPLARARETAEIVAAELGLENVLRDEPRLGHGFDRDALTGILADNRDLESLVLVGHEPDFSEAIEELTGGRVVMKKGGLARVDFVDVDARSGQLVWLLPPKVLGLR